MCEQKQKEQLETVQLHREQQELEEERLSMAEPIRLEQEEEEAGLQQDQLLADQIRALYPPARAERISRGRVKMNMSRTHRNLKERRRDRALDQKMKKKYGANFNHVSYHLLRHTVKCHDQRQNSLRDFGDEALEKGVDNRVLRIFSQGYELKNGRPATRADAAAKAADDEYMADYISCDVQRRWRHLDRIVNDILKSRCSPNMLEPECMARYGGEYKVLCDRMCYVENVIKDPINRPYFDAMEPRKKERLMRYVDNDTSPLVMFDYLFPHAADSMGVSVNDGKFYTDSPVVEFGKTLVQTMRPEFEKRCREFKWD